MKFDIQREALLKPLQMVAGAVEKRQTMAILSNVLVDVKSHQLSLTGTDTEVELLARATLTEPAETGRTTIPARKLMDICRALPDNAPISITLDGNRVLVKSKRSRFTLSTLSPDEFPNVEESKGEFEFVVQQKELRSLIERTHFAMAQQDVRYYLNGLLLEMGDGKIRAVATDGHRLALSDVAINNSGELYRVIVPRKGILDLLRLLDNSEEEITVTLSSNHLRVHSAEFTFTSKLIDGEFPDYNRVIPKGGNNLITIDRDIFKSALSRVSILSNEKFKGVRVQLENNVLRLIATNPEQEEAEEELEITYNQNALDLGFNVLYLLDVFSTLPAGEVKLTFIDENNCILIESSKDPESVYVVMPMRV